MAAVQRFGGPADQPPTVDHKIMGVNREQFTDIETLQEGTAEAILHAGGFVLADPFETLLQKISEDYLREAWSQLTIVLQRYQLQSFGLSWGWFHPGVSNTPGLKEQAPHSYLGWSSLKLADFYLDERFTQINQELLALTPKLRCIVSSRSQKWRIEPTDYKLALRFIENMCTEDVTDWVPKFVLEDNQNVINPWVNIARAILNEDQSQLDLALGEAKANYSSLGYQILVRGYKGYLEPRWNDIKIHISNI